MHYTEKDTTMTQTERKKKGIPSLGDAHHKGVGSTYIKGNTTKGTQMNELSKENAVTVENPEEVSQNLLKTLSQAASQSMKYSENALVELDSHLKESCPGPDDSAVTRQVKVESVAELTKSIKMMLDARTDLIDKTMGHLVSIKNK